MVINCARFENIWQIHVSYVRQITKGCDYTFKDNTVMVLMWTIQKCCLSFSV